MFNVILPKFNPFTKNACNKCTDFCIGGSIALLSPVQIVIMLVRRTPYYLPLKGAIALYLNKLDFQQHQTTTDLQII